MTAIVAAAVLAVLAVFAVLAWVVVVMRRVQTPTSGARIGRDSRPGTAVLVVDMQTDFVEGNGYDQADVADKVERINARVAEARAAGVPVATIRQIYQGPIATTVIKLVGKGLGNPGSNGLGLHHTLDVETEADFVKSRLDGFSNPALERWLASHDVGEVEIMGLDGCYCVSATAHGALNRGFDVTLSDSMILASDQQRWLANRQKLAAAGATASPS